MGKKILAILLSAVMCLAMTSVGFAASVTQDGLEVTLTTDKESYSQEESIEVTLAVTNKNEAAINDVNLETLIPDGYILVDDFGAEKQVSLLGVGETAELTVILTAEALADSVTDSGNADSTVSTGSTGLAASVRTGDVGEILRIVILLLIAAVVIVILIVRKKQSRRILSLFLCCALSGGLLFTGDVAQAAEEESVNRTITIETEVSVGGDSLAISGRVGYTPAEGLSDYYTVTFESNGGSEVESQQVASGETAVEPAAPTRDGFTFIGWYLSDGYSAAFDFSQPITSDLTVYAKWYDDSDTSDSDGDGLSDSLEITFGTDPTDKDTDDDGVSDYYELNWLNTNPLSDDTDGNGVTDGEEDSDSDGLTNAEEEALGLNPIYKDSDYDSLADYDEVYVYGTDPLNEDTDGDGVSDGTEILIGSDPLQAEVAFTTEKFFGELDDYTTVTASASVVTDADGAGTLEIDEVDVTDNSLISRSIPGYLGSAYDFTTDGTFFSATITFTYDMSLGTVGEDFQPSIYYFNEETGAFEEVDSVINEDGSVSAEVTHFSTYILLNKIAFDEVWDTDFRSPDDQSSVMTGLDVVFVIDSSGSMSSNDSNGLRLDAAKEFVDKLGEDDRGAVIDFDSSAVLYQSFTTDHDALYEAIDRVDSSGGTNLSNGMNLAIAQFTDESYVRQDAYKYIIFLTDGDGSYSTAYTARAAENDIIVYTIGLGSGVKADILTAIAEGTGGKYYFASTASTLSSIYDDISVEVIDYSTDSNNDGISDYYTSLINSGDLVLSTGSRELIGVTDMFGEDSDDWDEDGLKNGEEISVETVNGKTCVKMKTNPLLADTDADGYGDAMEIELETSPVKYTQLLSNSLEGLTDGSDYVYVNYAENDSAAADLTKFFDWQKTDESKTLVIDYFYDYASAETLEANAEAIANLEVRETVVTILDTAVSVIGATKDVLDAASSAATDASDVKDEVNEINKNRKALINSVNSDDSDAIKDAADKLGAVAKGTDLITKVNSVSTDTDEKVKAVTSALSALIKCFDRKLIPVGGALGDFADNYQVFMGTTNTLGISNGTTISIVSDMAGTAIDIFGTCNTYAKIQANTEAFDAYIDLLKYIYQNGGDSYVRTAAGDVAECVLDDSWESYYSQLSAAVGKDVALGTIKVILDVADSTNPYIKIGTTIYKLAKAAVSATGMTANAKAMVEAEVMTEISVGCTTNLLPYIVTEGFYFSYSVNSYAKVQKYMTQLAQSRIVGENFMRKRLGNGDIAVFASKLITGTSTSEIEEMFQTIIGGIYKRAENLSLTLSPNLPYYEDF